jgi:hypothetical protein
MSTCTPPTYKVVSRHCQGCHALLFSLSNAPLGTVISTNVHNYVLIAIMGLKHKNKCPNNHLHRSCKVQSTAEHSLRTHARTSAQSCIRKLLPPVVVMNMLVHAQHNCHRLQYPKKMVWLPQASGPAAMAGHGARRRRRCCGIKGLGT